jgi:hypothetical protein
MKPSSYNPFYKWLILLTIGLSSAHASQALRADGRSPPGCDSGKRKRSSWHFLGSRCSRWTSPIVTQIESAATRAVTGGGVDVVFNNAGYGMSGPLEGLTDEQILRMVNTNLLGRFARRRHSSSISDRGRKGCSSIPPQSADCSPSRSTPCTTPRNGLSRAGARAWRSN